MKTRITELLQIQYPIIQAGMSWASSCSELPLAVTNAGGLGVIAAGPMFAEDFRQTVRDVKVKARGPWAVNIPLYRPEADQILNVIEEERPPIIIAAQGSPKPHLERFQSIGCKWIHVVASAEHAHKAAAAGVDALIVVGSEAGGHPPANGVSTLVAVRRILKEISIPIIAGGGAADGFGILALLALGADAVQLGTRFLLTQEANVSLEYKHAVQGADVDSTVLVGPARLPVRLIRNRYAQAMEEADSTSLGEKDYERLMQSSSLRLAAVMGDIDWGKIEAGQSAGLIKDIIPAAQLMNQLISEMKEAIERLNAIVV